MILDYRDPSLAARQLAFSHSVVDAATGEVLDTEAIFYADDAAGVYHRYLKDAQGRFYDWNPQTKQPVSRDTSDRSTPREAAWEKVERAIRIVPKAL